MATVTEPSLRGSDQATTPRPEAAPRAAAEPGVFRADWLALQVWFVACVLMWSVQVLDCLTGLWRK